MHDSACGDCQAPLERAEAWPAPTCPLHGQPATLHCAVCGESHARAGGARWCRVEWMMTPEGVYTMTEERWL